MDSINDQIVLTLLSSLSDSSEEVVKRDIAFIAQLCSYTDSTFYSSFMQRLLKLFRNNHQFLESRGYLIFLEFSRSMDPERLLVILATILEHEDAELANPMVQILNTLLMSTIEFDNIRSKLRNFSESKEGTILFSTLYRAWCHNAVATLSLCLLAQAYEFAFQILQFFTMEIPVTVSILVQMDKLVQLIESPIFTPTRMHLLEPDRYPFLFKCLYGILMILPQSSAFVTLKNRINSVNSLVSLQSFMCPTLSLIPSKKKVDLKSGEILKWADLFAHFRLLQIKRPGLESLNH
jgi:vacuole morphology and inheritance protein 14